MNVGTYVKLKSNCMCRMTLLLDCYHRSCEVRLVFRDKKSVWIRNNHGWGRRAMMRDLIPVNG